MLVKTITSALLLANTLFYKSSLISLPIASLITTNSARAMTSSSSNEQKIDYDYPGTAVERMLNIREKVKSLSTNDLKGDWDNVRVNIINAGGLKDIRNAQPGSGYTGHAFNDFNHCDLTPMKTEVKHNDNLGQVDGIAFNNPLGKGIEIASIKELGPGCSWSTCMIGCNQNSPQGVPQDVAHVQFKSRIAFKLVWVPPNFESFVLVDDDGNLLNQSSGKLSGNLPSLRERSRNFMIVEGSKYATEAIKKGAEEESL